LRLLQSASFGTRMRTYLRCLPFGEPLRLRPAISQKICMCISTYQPSMSLAVKLHQYLHYMRSAESCASCTQVLLTILYPSSLPCMPLQAVHDHMGHRADAALCEVRNAGSNITQVHYTTNPCLVAGVLVLSFILPGCMLHLKPLNSFTQ
jgi:hypothetical protein